MHTQYVWHYLSKSLCSYKENKDLKHICSMENCKENATQYGIYTFIVVQ